MNTFLKLALFAQVAVLANLVAGSGYGMEGGGALGGSMGGGYGMGSGSFGGGSLGAGGYGMMSGGGHGYGYHSIPLAVHGGYHHVEAIPTHSTHYSKPTYVDVPAGVAPIILNFQSQSSPMKVTNHHISAPGSVHHSHSVDEPHKLYHHVTKPVYQEVHETVVPHRQIIQTIKPVSESIKTVVHKKDGYGSMGGGMGGMGGGGGMY